MSESVIDSVFLILESTLKTMVDAIPGSKRDPILNAYGELLDIIKKDKNLYQEFKSRCEQHKHPIIRSEWMNISNDPSLNLAYCFILEQHYPLLGKSHALFKCNSNYIGDELLEKMKQDVEILEKKSNRLNSLWQMYVILELKMMYREALTYLDRYIEKTEIAEEDRIDAMNARKSLMAKLKGADAR